MNRRGAALLLVLWLVVLLTGLVAVGLGGVRTGSEAARNRLALMRAGWAGEACLEILLGRVSADSARFQAWDHGGLDSVDLGNGVWCTLEIEDTGTKVHLNLADPEALLAMIGDSALAGMLLRGRPWPAVDSVRDVLGARAGREPEWLGFTTVRGTGRVNLNRAPLLVLRSVPGLDEEGAKALIAARGLGRALRSRDEVLATLPTGVRERVLAQYDRFLAVVALDPEVLVVTVTGHVSGLLITSHGTITLVPSGRRLAVIRREIE